jgi:hypothetical protein
MEQNKASFILAGFSHDFGFRVFEFDCVEKGRPRARYTVRADMTLVRKYGIHVQELPLLCRRLLDRREEIDQALSLTLPEAEMVACAEKEAARVQSARKSKPWQRPSADNSARPDPDSGDGANPNGLR